MSRLLLLSSSRRGATGYLEHARPLIDAFLAAHDTPVRRILFLPYAGVTKTPAAYTDQVGKALGNETRTIVGIQDSDDARTAIETADAIMVGGGNTFALLQRLYAHDLLAPIRQRVAAGVPYIGWSAGANIAGPTLCTTNDMPIVAPPSFEALGLVPFQINPHFISGVPAGHNGESREQRLAEYMVLNPQARVVALREGTALERHDNTLTLRGSLDGELFAAGEQSPLAAGRRHDALLTDSATT